MNILEIKNKLQNEEYDFLRKDKHLGNNIILLTVGGSHAYGTENENSDLDIRGITLENVEDVLGLSNFEQFTNNPTDTTIYGLRKIITLLMNCNPNVIEMLGTKEDQLFILSPEGKLLRDNINLFLSKKAMHSFGGYATAQLRRLQNALARDNYPQEEKEIHILNSVKHQIKHLQEHYKEFTDQELKLYIDKSDKEDYETEIFMNIDLKKYPLRDFKSMYSEMNNIVKDYSKINHRNNKKDDLHLNKHAMHLVRLLIMGTEILNGEGVNTYREKDKEFLLSIRNGFYQNEDSSFKKEFFDLIDDLEKKLKLAFNNSKLPEKPNYNKIEDLLISIYKGRFF